MRPNDPPMGILIAEDSPTQAECLRLLLEGEGGTVTVAWEPVPGERLRVRLTDAGPGIPPTLLDRLFVPFDRLGAEQTGVGGAERVLATQQIAEAIKSSVIPG